MAVETKGDNRRNGRILDCIGIGLLAVAVMLIFFIVNVIFNDGSAPLFSNVSHLLLAAVIGISGGLVFRISFYSGFKN